MAAAQPPALQFAFEARVELGPVQEVGRLPDGQERRIIPIVGGTFEGPGLAGTVLNGGADWQIVQSTGTIELDARYTLLDIATGALIYVSNQGVRTGPPEVLARLRRGESVDPSQYYFRCTPRFETAAPELRWLMDSIFIGSAERHAAQVHLHFWRVG